MARGRAKWFNDEEGFGLILGDDGHDIFVHYSGIEGEGRRTLQSGERVRFEIGEGPDGRQCAKGVVKEEGAV